MAKYRLKPIEVEVRRLTRRESVVTPFGVKSGWPGHYVVTDDYGQNWIVPPEEFNHFVEKAPADSE